VVRTQETLQPSDEDKYAAPRQDLIEDAGSAVERRQPAPPCGRDSARGAAHFSRRVGKASSSHAPECIETTSRTRSFIRKSCHCVGISGRSANSGDRLRAPKQFRRFPLCGARPCASIKSRTDGASIFAVYSRSRRLGVNGFPPITAEKISRAGQFSCVPGPCETR
jgi:hypothetical protein